MADPDLEGERYFFPSSEIHVNVNLSPEAVVLTTGLLIGGFFNNGKHAAKCSYRFIVASQTMQGGMSLLVSLRMERVSLDCLHQLGSEWRDMGE